MTVRRRVLRGRAPLAPECPGPLGHLQVPIRGRLVAGAMIPLDARGPERLEQVEVSQGGSRGASGHVFWLGAMNKFHPFPPRHSRVDRGGGRTSHVQIFETLHARHVELGRGVDAAGQLLRPPHKRRRVNVGRGCELASKYALDATDAGDTMRFRL
jgi:hypothetical protein